MVKKAPPITPDILLDVARHVNVGNIEEMTSSAALVVGFTLFLRKSNLVPETIQGFNKQEQLTVEDVWCGKNLMMVEIKWSKTLQARDRELLLPLIPAKTPQLCAVRWIKYLLNHRKKVSVGQPLFAYYSGGQLIPLTYEKLSGRLKAWVSKTGRQGERFTLHRLRRGGANQALTVGIAGEDLQLMGDWKSRAYMEYLDLTLECKLTNMVRFVDETDARVGHDQWLTNTESVGAWK